jgi:hypothetical protein
LLYKNEMSANSNLCKAFAAPTAERACTDMFNPRKPESSLCYPRCLGLVRVVEDRLWDAGVIPFSASKGVSSICSGFLFEYIGGLKEITKEMITLELAADVKTALAAIHALNVRHNDFEDHSAFPDVRFGNLFIKEATGGK